MILLLIFLKKLQCLKLYKKKKFYLQSLKVISFLKKFSKTNNTAE